MAQAPSLEALNPSLTRCAEPLPALVEATLDTVLGWSGLHGTSTTEAPNPLEVLENRGLQPELHDAPPETITSDRLLLKRRLTAGSLALFSVLSLTTACKGGPEEVLCDDMPKYDSHSQKLNPGKVPTHATITQNGAKTDLGYFKKVVTAVHTNSQTGNKTETTITKHSDTPDGTYTAMTKTQTIQGYTVKLGGDGRPVAYCNK